MSLQLIPMPPMPLMKVLLLVIALVCDPAHAFANNTAPVQVAIAATGEFIYHFTQKYATKKMFFLFRRYFSYGCYLDNF